MALFTIRLPMLVDLADASADMCWMSYFDVQPLDEMDMDAGVYSDPVVKPLGVYGDPGA